MFTNIENQKNSRNTDLYVFKSDNPISDNWIPAFDYNPVISKNGGRNAGVLNISNNSLYRLGQKFGFGEYGHSVTINKVKLFNKNYSEVEIKNIKNNFNKNFIGIHHLNNNDDYVTFDLFKNKNLWTKN